MIPIKRLFVLSVFSILLTVNILTTGDKPGDLPVKHPSAIGYTELLGGENSVRTRGIRNLYSIKQIHKMIRGGNTSGLIFNASFVNTLLDGSKIDSSKIYGRVYTAPYPFEKKEGQYTYKRFRVSSPIIKGKGVIQLKYFLRKWMNSEGWTDKGQIVVRVHLMLEREKTDRDLGTYDTFVIFRKIGGLYRKMVSITEGPFINNLQSDDPKRVIISLKTSNPVIPKIILNDKRVFSSNIKKTNHEIEVNGLKPNRRYSYRIKLPDYSSKEYYFNSAPVSDERDVVFSYCGDSREGSGGGERTFMGVNYFTMERIANLSYLKKSDFFIFGGDLVNGRTANIDDFRTQIYGWKQLMSGFWHKSPVYTCIGNHEALLRFFRNKKNELVMFDRWPYKNESVEAVFGDVFIHPTNGPLPSDRRRPSYKENVYSFRYGPVKIIAFNNNYWISKTRGTTWRIPEKFGGCPEGYIFEDQLKWIEKEVRDAEKDPKVRYTILFAQEPVFPNGGHISDCMWYEGDNGTRAFTYDPKSGKVVPEKHGIIEVRNRIVRLFASSKKVAAVLGADEHSYHKVLIDKNVPIGNMKKDYNKSTGKVWEKGESCSPLDDLKYPVWYLVSGGGGAPYYSEESTPWNKFWKNNPGFYPRSKHTSDNGCYYYSSQENFMLFKANKKKISVTIFNPYGEIIDRIDNLMSIKK